MANLLQVQNLTVQRGRHVLYRHFSCQLNHGECVWLRGRNGGGKTSLLLTVSGLLPSEKHQVLWQGRAIEDDTRLHELWYYCPHQPTLKNVWTVNENVQFALNIAGCRVKQQDIIEQAQYWGVLPLLHKPASYLSQGQRRRVALMRLTLLPFRPAWLLDEPFDALDQQAQNLLAQVMNQHLVQNGAILMTSHFQPPASLQISREIELVGEI